MTVLTPPFCPDEQREELGEDGLDGPFNAHSEFGYVDYGDDHAFPTDTAVVAAMTIPEEWDAGEIGGYALDGLYIDPAEGHRLLAVARDSGAVLVRDDDLINRLYWPEDVGRG